MTQPILSIHAPPEARFIRQHTGAPPDRSPPPLTGWGTEIARLLGIAMLCGSLLILAMACA
jgi:hypothetical protein